MLQSGRQAPSARPLSEGPVACAADRMMVESPNCLPKAQGQYQQPMATACQIEFQV